jgi:hypothetical protein
MSGITKTEVANNALAFLAAGRISNVLDFDDEKSRQINAVFDSVAKQVIRSHRWSCCIKRATLSQLTEIPTTYLDFGYKYKYQLPSDSLRFLDLNGEPWSSKTLRFDINNALELHTDDGTVNIRYVAWISEPAQWDVLLAEAVAVKLAQRIARRITKDGISPEALNAEYQRAVANAMRVDAMEVGSGENSPLERILETSPIVQAGRQGSFSRNSIIGINVDYSVPR